MRTLTGHGDSVYSVAFDNNDIIASGSVDKTIKLWNKNTGDLMRTLTGHGGYINYVAFDNNDILASGSLDWTIKLWSKSKKSIRNNYQTLEDKKKLK